MPRPVGRGEVPQRAKGRSQDKNDVPSWALYRGGPQRLGRSPWRLPRQVPKVRWRYVAGRSIAVQATLDAHGRVYLASLDGYVHALDAKGKRRWRARVGAEIFTSPQLTPWGLLVGGDDERLRLLSTKDGAQQWSVRAGPCNKLPGFGPDRVLCHVDSAPVSRGGVVYFAADALYALDVASGKVRWRKSLPGHAHGALALAGDTLIVATQGFAVLAFARDDGRLLWNHPVRGHCDTTPAIAGDRVYVGCDDAQLHALGLADGKPLWTLRTRRAVRSSPAVDKAGRVYFGSYDHRLRAVDRDGKLLWSLRTGGPVHASPLVDAHGTLVFGSQDDHLYGVDSESGRLLWRFLLGGDVDASPVAGPDGTLYVGADDGVLTALR
ncbi:MAG: PQQ-binding-like beta-propeller repeat protein [Deltaproteobacteria bacterium]|nr:PQQ-binding-like beta-propeller repeat protein [Deltaproteobacteria bacterium]